MRACEEERSEAGVVRAGSPARGSELPVAEAGHPWSTANGSQAPGVAALPLKPLAGPADGTPSWPHGRSSEASGGWEGTGGGHILLASWRR